MVAAEVKERPILFSAPMIKALLDGRKTQTRRIIKPQPVENEGMGCRRLTYFTKNGKPSLNESVDPVPVGQMAIALCPHGDIGDRLWVRELHWRWGKWAKNGLTKSGRTKWKFVPVGTSIRYAENAPKTTAKRDGECGWVYRHARFMFRAHSRITQQITEVLVQQLQEISDEDAIAEGLSCVTKDGTLYKYGVPDLDGLPGNDDHGWEWREWDIDPRMAYFKLWNKINGDGAAATNPWVWAVTMKVLNG